MKASRQALRSRKTEGELKPYKAVITTQLTEVRGHHPPNISKIDIYTTTNNLKNNTL